MSSSRVIVLPTCSICQDEDAGMDIVVTQCGHAFHSNCIRQWDNSRRARRQTTKCPACNVDLQRPPNTTNTTPLQSRFIRLHSLTEKTLHPAQPLSDSQVQTQWDQCKQEIITLKDALRQNEAKIRSLTLEPEALKRERDAAQSRVKLLERNMQEIEHQKKTLTFERQKERKHNLDLRNNHLNQTKQLHNEIEKLNDKCRTLKNDRDQLQEQITQKISENEELQSFVSEFSREKKQFQVIETELRNQLNESMNKVKTLVGANQKYNRKLEETKKKINVLENQIELPVVNNTMFERYQSASVRHCSKFYPDACIKPKPTMNGTNVATKTSNAKGKQPERKMAVFQTAQLQITPSNDNISGIQQGSSDLSRSKRFRINHDNNNYIESSQSMQIKSESEDITIYADAPSSSTNIPSSSPPNLSSKAAQNVVPPPLFGNHSSFTPLKRPIISPSSAFRNRPRHQISARLSDPVPRIASISSLISNDKLVAIGPKIRHR